MKPFSPNIQIMPLSAELVEGVLHIGGCSTVALAKQFGTPLLVVDEKTILDSIDALKAGLSSYNNVLPLYAAKAFMCLAMGQIIKNAHLGIDVVSQGELITAIATGFPANTIFLHGNNKSESELTTALTYGDVQIVVDNLSELELLTKVCRDLSTSANVLFRIIPGVETDTHHYIQTGHELSKFGIPITELAHVIKYALACGNINPVGLHAHIGSQAHDLKPYLQLVSILADCFVSIKKEFGLVLSKCDIGGGLGITYTTKDQALPIYDWAASLATEVIKVFNQRNFPLPQLLVEPGRSIVGTAGVTLYRAGHVKKPSDNMTYLAVDGGMADNPRPVMYQANYTAITANKTANSPANRTVTIVGKYCESGDIIVKDVSMPATTGDLIAVFSTGAYTYSMSSNYNRTPRPACVLVANGQAEVILERESNQDLLRLDRVPKKLLKD